MRQLTVELIGALRDRLARGITQVELGKLLDGTSRDASRTAQRLVSKGFARRTSVLRRGRWTYRLRLKGDFSDNDLLACIPGILHSSGPRLDFVAPDLTPRISEAVRLRLSGLKVREVAARMGISADTVDAYLGMARDPSKYIRTRLERGSPDISSGIDRVQKLLAKNGIVASVEHDVRHMYNVARYLSDNEYAQYVTFPHQQKYFGRLAGGIIIYCDKEKAANFLFQTILADVLNERKGFSRHTSTRSGLTHAIREAIPADSELAGLLVERIKGFHVGNALKQLSEENPTDKATRSVRSEIENEEMQELVGQTEFSKDGTLEGNTSLRRWAGKR